MVSETMDVKDGSPQSETSSTVGQTLTVKDSGEKVHASGKDSDDELPEILSADSDSEDEDSTDDDAEDKSRSTNASGFISYS